LATVVDKIYAELRSARALIEKSDSIGDRAAFESIAVKTLVLSAASYFELEICRAIRAAADASSVPLPLTAFIEKQGLERKYHSLFSWDAGNVNRLFSFFGEPARSRFVSQLAAANLSEAVSHFLFINRTRNNLVHENYAGALIELTFEEAWQKYSDAVPFVTWFARELLEACQTATTN
jgi:RiboL-PSP-HEPN